MYGSKQVFAVETPYGQINTNIVLNASGAWSNDIAKMVGLNIPLIPIKHAYVVTEAIEAVKNLPNVRDPDISLYFKVQGGSMSIGGYEKHPSMLQLVSL